MYIYKLIDKTFKVFLYFDFSQIFYEVCRICKKSKYDNTLNVPSLS